MVNKTLLVFFGTPGTSPIMHTFCSSVIPKFFDTLECIHAEDKYGKSVQFSYKKERYPIDLRQHMFKSIYSCSPPLPKGY